jgi:hypothetical protein
MDVRRLGVDRRSRDHRLAFQPGLDASRRLHGRSGQPLARQHVSVLHSQRSNDGRQLFRPGFTQGVWATGEPVKGLSYLFFIGNGLNTLNVSATKIDTNLLYSGSVWWEPLGAYGEPGKSRNMYDDYFAQDNTRIRDRRRTHELARGPFLESRSIEPENTSMHNSDGVLTFATGAFAPGVTVQEAKYELAAIDGGVKRNGLAINGQLFSAA